MNYTVAIMSSTELEIRKHLLRADGQEDLCFAMWRPSQGATTLTALIQTAVILPQSGERNIHGNASFEATYFLRAAQVAADVGCGLALLHSHPLGKGWQSLSIDDRQAEHRYAAPAMAVTGLPLLGMTMAGDADMSARMWTRGEAGTYKDSDCVSVRIVGDRMAMTYHPKLRPLSAANAKQLRTVSAWGTETQARLANLRIAVVGLGSVGSIVAEALARMGVRNLVLMDFDAVENHNLDRTLNIDVQHIGQAKVGAIADSLKKHATAADFEVIPCEDSIVESAGYRAVLDCDVAFSCVDRPWPRQVLNFLAYAHYLPVVDGGIAIDARGGTFRGAEWKAHVATPGRKCLECLEQFDGTLVEMERQGLLDDPVYIKGLPDDHPAKRRENVFAFSTATAALQLTQFLQMFTAPSGIADIGGQTYHFITGEIDRDEAYCRPSCLYSSDLVLGMGDSSGLVVTGRHRVAENARRTYQNVNDPLRATAT